MTIATGVAKSLRIKQETTWGTAAAASGYTALRRLTSSLDLTKATYRSNEIRTDYQRSDFRHGMRSVEGAISGELSCTTYADFFQAALRRDFTAGVSATGLSLTIAGAGPYTLTRGAGSYLTDGFKVGDVVRITAGAVNANNLNKNALVTALTATVMTVIPVTAGMTLTAEGPIASTTVAVTGKKTWVPTSGHTDRSYTVEHWFANIAQSELFTGCKVGQVDVNLPATGMAEVNFAIQGKDITTGTAAYFTGTETASSGGTLAAVNGILLVNGTAVGNVTGMNFSINGNLSTQEVVGSNASPDIFVGSIDVSGQMTALFENATLRDMFINETEASLVFVLTAGNAKDSHFLAFNLPRIKVGGSSKDDGEKGLQQTIPFTALLNTAGGTGTSGDATTIAIQDSSLT